jgi:multidrug efflux pump subunit AcrB
MISRLLGATGTQRRTAEVGSAILAATLSFLAIFLPFLLVPGLTSLLIPPQK